jgi:hypothetical protein
MGGVEITMDGNKQTNLLILGPKVECSNRLTRNFRPEKFLRVNFILEEREKENEELQLQMVR